MVGIKKMKGLKNQIMKKTSLFICTLLFISSIVFYPKISFAYPFWAQQNYESPREATGKIVCANCHLAQMPTIAEVPQSVGACLLYTSPSPRDALTSRMPSSA